MEEAGGTFHTGKLVLGLRRAALERDVRIYEQTRVERVTEGTPIRVITPHGTITADKGLLASNAHTPEIGEPGHRLYPLYEMQFETEPLTDEQLAAIGGGCTATPTYRTGTAGWLLLPAMALWWVRRRTLGTRAVTSQA